MPKILGMGEALPARRVQNEELARSLGCSADEIERGSGVETRYYAADGEGPSDLACRAAETALQESGFTPRDVDFLVFATMTPDVTFPGSGCYLQDKLGCDTIGALDVRAQCTGFLVALEIAGQLLRAGTYRRILVAGADVHSSGLDFSPRGADVTPLFGDGAAVAVLGVEGEGLVESVHHSDATQFERFWCEFPSSRRRPVRLVAEDIRAGRHFPRIDAEAVKRDGFEQMTAGVEEVLSKSGFCAADVSRYFFHHVFPEVAERAAETLGVAGRSTVSGRGEGHIASASLAMSLCRARRTEEVRPGDLVCLATAGSGANWGATLIRL